MSKKRIIDNDYTVAQYYGDEKKLVQVFTCSNLILTLENVDEDKAFQYAHRFSTLMAISNQELQDLMFERRFIENE